MRNFLQFSLCLVFVLPALGEEATDAQSSKPMEMAAVLQDRWEFPFSYQHDLDVQKSILLSSEIPLI